MAKQCGYRTGDVVWVLHPKTKLPVVGEVSKVYYDQLSSRVTEILCEDGTVAFYPGKRTFGPDIEPLVKESRKRIDRELATARRKLDSVLERDRELNSLAAREIGGLCEGGLCG